MNNPRPTLADVAKLAGVSISTASLAFSQAGPVAPATRKRVLAAAEQLNYSGPNPLGRQLRSGKSGIIGVIVGGQLGKSFRDPVSLQVLDGLVSTLGDLGLGVLLIPGNRGLNGNLDPLLETAAIDVAVFIWGTYPEDPRLHALRQRNIPIVIGEGVPIDNSPLVAIDDRNGYRKLAQTLYNDGHRRFVTVTLPFTSEYRSGWVDTRETDHITWASTRNRLNGLKDAEIDVVGIFETPGSLLEYGRAAAKQVLDPNSYPDGKLPTAVLAHSDLLAAGIILEAREMGLRVPEDISVAGFDGIELSWFQPDILTSVYQSSTEKGTAMARATEGLLAGTPPEQIVLPVEVVRGTTTAPIQLSTQEQ